MKFQDATAIENNLRRYRPPLFVWLPASLVALLVLLPPVYLGVRTFTAYEAAWELLANTRTLAIVGRSLLLVILVTTVSAVLGVSLAWLTVRTDLPLRRVFAVATALPLVIPSYVFAMLVVVALGPRGMLQGWLEPLGVDRLPEIFGLPGAVLSLSLLSYPYVLLPVRAALHGVDPAMEEAARGLGRGAMATFATVTLPLIRPAVVAGGLLAALYTLSDFGVVSLLRYQTFTWAIFIQYQTAFDRTAAAGLSLTLVGLAVSLLVLESRTRGRAVHYRVTPGMARRRIPISLGRWRWPALLYVATVCGVALLAPLGILLFWVVRGVSAGEPLALLWSNTLSSVTISMGAAALTALAGIPIAVLVVRFPSRVASALSRLTFVGFALPGVAVALAFVFFATAVLPIVYQTALLLLLAYLVLFLPASVGAIESSLRQLSPRLEEAARGLGRTPAQAFRSVTAPLLMRGILAGATLVFLLVMKELPATLILSPLGFQTLATSVWGAASEAFFARAAMPALMLVLTASVPMAFLVTREGR
jgi:iron(III) transport system permease protein